MLNEYHTTWIMGTDVHVTKGARCNIIQTLGGVGGDRTPIIHFHDVLKDLLEPIRFRGNDISVVC